MSSRKPVIKADPLANMRALSNNSKSTIIKSETWKKESFKMSGNSPSEIHNEDVFVSFCSE